MKYLTVLLIFLLISQAVFAQTKIDEFGVLSSDDISSRLDSFTSQLRESLKSRGLVIMSRENAQPLGQFLRHFYGIQQYISNSFGNSVKPEFWLEEENRTNTQGWLIGENEPFPQIKTVSPENKLKEKITKKILFDRECLDCSPAVMIDLFIFREGLDYLAEAFKANPDSTILMEIDKVGYFSGNIKERRELSRQILDTLVEKHKIPQNRIKIKFTAGHTYAKFYIVPAKAK